MIGGPGSFKKALRAEFDGIGDFCGGKSGALEGRRTEGDAGLGRVRKEKADGPIAVGGMRAEEREGVGMTCGQDSVNLRVEARIVCGHN